MMPYAHSEPVMVLAAQADLHTAARHRWVHDENRDGHGCCWCGAWAQVNGENLCRDCWEEDE